MNNEDLMMEELICEEIAQVAGASANENEIPLYKTDSDYPIIDNNPP